MFLCQVGEVHHSSLGTIISVCKGLSECYWKPTNLIDSPKILYSLTEHDCNLATLERTDYSLVLA